MQDQIPHLDLRSILLFALFQVIILGANQLRIIQKRKGKDVDLDTAKDELAIKQGVAAIDAYELVKAKNEALTQELSVRDQLHAKISQRHDQLHAQNSELETRCTQLEKDLAVALGKVAIITDIAHNLTLELHIKNKNDVQLKEKGNAQ